MLLAFGVADECSKQQERFHATQTDKMATLIVQGNVDTMMVEAQIPVHVDQMRYGI